MQLIEEDTQELVMTTEAARILGITYGGVLTLIRRGKLQPATVTTNGVTRRIFRREYIEELAEERRRVPPRPGGYGPRRPRRPAATAEKGGTSDN